MSNDTTESPYQIPHELVALRQKSDEDCYRVSLSKAAQDAGIEKGSKVTVQLDLQETPPMIIIGSAPDDTELPGMEVRTFHQKVLVPNKDLEDLGIDLNSYDDTQEPFLFYPHVLEEMIALEPLGYASDVLDDQDADRDVEADEDATEADEPDVNEASEPATAVSPDDITATSNATGVSESELKQAVTTVTTTVDRDDLDDIRSDEFNPLLGDETEIVFVKPDKWTAMVGDALDRDEDLVEAVRLAFNRAARDVIGADRDYRRFEKSADAVVLRD
ncbi:hypothetical protein [Halorussus salinus]|uniref:hypothetical protein n=1 Tax=Halorussus salinus TaxID=1364935 RepID=UPI0010924FDA|nr:hypothetical protein [Halorussus salinus]